MNSELAFRFKCPGAVLSTGTLTWGQKSFPRDRIVRDGSVFKTGREEANREYSKFINSPSDGPQNAKS